MSARIDMTGLRFGRLVGVRFVSLSKIGKARWLFRCDCGENHEAEGVAVRCGVINSCGCLREDVAKANQTTHGMSRTAEHKSWLAMKRRCYNKNYRDFECYGGRGITVCAEWRDSFEQFYTDMGPRPPGLTLERKENSLGYSKDNCVWATDTEQSRNRRFVVMSIELAREVKSVRDSGGNLSAWARAHNVSKSAARNAAIGLTWRQ